MKKALPFFAILFTISANAQEVWQWQNPTPFTNLINNLYFIDDSTGWAVGNSGSLFKTTDGGRFWTYQANNAVYDYKTVHFIDSNKGWVAGGNFDQAELQVTTNGGSTWTDLSAGLSQSLKSIYFVNEDIGWAVNVLGQLLKSSNGGVNWQIVSGVTQVGGVYFINEQIGFAYGLELKRTADGGNTWSNVSSSENGINDIQFINNNTGYLCGNLGLLAKTTDQGLTWETLNPGSFFDMLHIQIQNENDILVSATSGELLASANAGQTWSSIYTVESSLEISCFRINNDNKGILFCETATYNPRVYVNFNSTDWLLYSTNLTASLSDVDFVSAQTGWAVGQSGAIYKTVDGGINWFVQNSGISTNLNSLVAFNENTIVAVGNAGMVLKSNDGGLSWNSLNLNSNLNFFDVKFPTPETGYIAGTGGSLYKTTDGGDTWTDISISTTADNLSMHWFNSDRGFISTNYGWYNKTEDGGLTWETNASQSLIYGSSRFIYFINNDIGFIINNTQDVGSVLKRTTDGGITWSSITGISTFLNSIIFTSANTGYMVGLGGVFKTEDAGITWVLQYPRSNFASFSGIDFVGEQDGWAVGGGGRILNTKQGGGFGFIASEINIHKQSDHFKLYPNPTHDVVFIESNIKHYTLEILNSTGLEVFKSEEGNTLLNTDEWPSGIYFLLFSYDSKMEVKKLIKH